MRRDRNFLTRAGILLGALCVAAAAQATTYKWKDPKTGRLVISDQPPPPGVKTIGKRTGSTSAGPTPISNMPLATRKAVAEFPVLLFTADSCLEACADARGFLNGRGIPYTELSTRDPAILTRLEAFGEPKVPTLLVGQQALKGFESGNWSQTLDLAGYPKEAPVGYRAPLPPPPPEPEENDTQAAEGEGEAPAFPAGDDPSSLAQ